MMTVDQLNHALHALGYDHSDMVLRILMTPDQVSVTTLSFEGHDMIETTRIHHVGELVEDES
jgi:hypothetical protein